MHIIERYIFLCLSSAQKSKKYEKNQTHFRSSYEHVRKAESKIRLTVKFINLGSEVY